MSKKKWLAILFSVSANLWIVRIIDFSILTALVMLACSVVFFLSLQTEKKIYLGVFIVLLSLLSFRQVTMTTVGNPFQTSGETTKTVQFFQITNQLGTNFAEAFDINFYFFANHPRERFPIREFEKFPYVLLIPFIIGFFKIQKKQLGKILLSLIPLTLVIFTGNVSSIGPIGLFPFIVNIIALGVMHIFINWKTTLIFFVVFVPVFIQTIIYAY